jgi:signal transduction histidine kinase
VHPHLAGKDVTAFRGAPLAGSKSANMFREYADSAPLALAIADADDGRVRYANGLFLDTLHVGEIHSGERLVDLAASPGAPRQAIEQLDALFAQVQRRHEPRLDVEMLDGPQCAWSVSLWPLHGSAPPDSLIAIMIRDVADAVTARHASAAVVEQLREVNEQLLLSTLREEDLRIHAESANEAKSVFVATMSHELRTPLAAILGYGELLHEGLSGPVTDEQRRQLGRIIASANHLLAIINDILTLSSADAGMPLRREPVNVRALLESTTTLVAPLLEGKGVLFCVDAPPEPLVVTADGLKLRQILVNLVGNAVKFTERGRIDLRVVAGASRIMFEVQDTGSGIAPQHLDHVFDAFWQLHAAPATRRFGGTGLGLNVSRKLAQLMGGDIEVESVVQQGSVFRLWIPAGVARD